MARLIIVQRDGRGEPSSGAFIIKSGADKGFSVPGLIKPMTELIRSDADKCFSVSDLIKSDAEKGFSMPDLIKSATEKGFSMPDLTRSDAEKGFSVADLTRSGSDLMTSDAGLIKPASYFPLFARDSLFSPPGHGGRRGKFP
jgi:hypothetical protein